MLFESEYVGEFSKIRSKILCSNMDEELEAEAQGGEEQPEESHREMVRVDTYFFERIERQDQEANFEVNMQMSAVQFLECKDIRDVISAHYITRSQLLISGWRANRPVVVMYDRNDPLNSPVLDHVMAFQTASFNDLLIVADGDLQRIVIKDLKDPKRELHVSKFGFKMTFDWVDNQKSTFSRVFSIMDNNLFYITSTEELVWINLSDKNFTTVQRGILDIEDFCITSSLITALTTYQAEPQIQRYLYQDGKTSSLNMKKVVGYSKYKFTTVYAYGDHVFIAGDTKQAHSVKHNIILMFNKKLDFESKVYMDKGFCECSHNPVHSMRVVWRKRVMLLIALHSNNYLNIFAIKGPTLVQVIKFKRLNSSRLCGLTLYNQYDSNFLVFGNDEFSEYKF